MTSKLVHSYICFGNKSYRDYFTIVQLKLCYFYGMLYVNNISFSYDKIPVLTQIDFKVKKGEHLTIIGESGSGKSTLLKLIYGEYDLPKGHVFWNHKEILGPKHNLIVGYDFIKQVTQEFDLMPFTTVSENIGTYLSNTNPSKKKKRITELLEVVEMLDYAKVNVRYLSGGQQQRVALAKALAKQPELLLLDEPFSHIDNFKKQSLRRSLFKFLKEENITCIMATHNHEDLMGYTDTMIVLEDTKIIAHNTPNAIYKNPTTKLIASFFGEFNYIEPYGYVYAHQLKVTDNSGLKARVIHSYFKGNHYLIEAMLGGQTIFFEHHITLEKDSEVDLIIKPL